MDWELKRLLELAGVKRLRTPDHILYEGDDEGGDPFASDDDDDPFGGDDDAGDEGGEDGGDGDEGGTREPPEELSPEEIEKYGSPRFQEIEDQLVNFFNSAITSASVGAQEREDYPGTPIPEDNDTTPAMEEPEEPEEEEEAEEPEEEEEDEKKEESFQARRDKALILEAQRLLLEADEEGAAADDFDMEFFASQIANYIRNIHNLADIEGGIFNMARQMILNNYGQQTEQEFIRMLAAKGNDLDFTGQHSDGAPEIPVAVGATAEGGAA